MQTRKKYLPLECRLIAACRSNPEIVQKTRDICEKIFICLQAENIQEILKAQNFNLFNELRSFTNRSHRQIVAHCFDEQRTTKCKLDHWQ